MTVILFVPIVAGLYVGRVRTAEALAAIAAGVSALLVLQLVNDGRGIGALSAPLVGLLAASLATVAAMAITRKTR
jgi:Na+/pantothenate symporter